MIYSCIYTGFVAFGTQQQISNLVWSDSKKKKKNKSHTILLNLINSDKLLKNLVDLNINLCTNISQSFSYFGYFVLFGIRSKWAQQHWKQTPRNKLYSTHFSFKISLMFSVFSTFSLPRFKLKALNTAKI